MTNGNGAMMESNCPGLNLISRGKVRDIYDLERYLLIVATDRVSAFDVVMPNPIPDKGKTLTQLSQFWLEYLDSAVLNHMITTNVGAYPRACRPYNDQLLGRSMLVKKADVFPIEAIVRGYLIGSGWEDYQRSGMVCGISLPKGLKQAEKLPEAIFTPSTKAGLGDHDQNISFDEMITIIGRENAERVKYLSLRLYERASIYARSREIILADTKFEFGLYHGQIILVDEALTPDSSRFWPADRYRVGCSPESFDKQFLRDYLKSIGWKKSDPAPELPREVVQNTRARYLQALKQLTGEDMAA